MATDPLNITSDARNTLLVVTALIVAVTFQAALNPPGGVWQDDKYDPEENCTVVPANLNNCTRVAQAGTSVLHLRSVVRYETFIFVNTLAFSATTSTILFLLLGSGTPFRTETIISIYCMNFAYAASVGAVQPQTPTTWAILLSALLSPYIFRFPSLIIERQKVAREQDVPQGPPVFQRGAC
ncbi:HOMEOBOX PROTEIN WARIAI [Salix koriyanagi]|uniref:HOMEOBOX PROTEIN WARIAI n=1 Tax=Salix koriyanagi TaxID=2511006 RepID=A0A9Q0X294_9ROSI|nr:HOMEOBOX PROTEIN WARIAI [Salix koriyanagi]